MKYFLDTEFHEYKKNGVNTIELISIGIVSETGESFYRVCKDFDYEAAFANEWLRVNVLEPISKMYASNEATSLKTAIEVCGYSATEIAQDIVAFVDDKPEFYGYYADYDWVVFCWLFGRMIDLPTGFPMYCRDLKQMLDDWANGLDTDFFTDLRTEEPMSIKEKLAVIKALPNYPTQENEHNALDDAKWNQRLFAFLTGSQRAAAI